MDKPGDVVNVYLRTHGGSSLAEGNDVECGSAKTLPYQVIRSVNLNFGDLAEHVPDMSRSC